MNNIVSVRVANHRNPVSVPITSGDKPGISPDFEEKWQELVDVAARIIGVPAGLIMRLMEQEIEIFRSSRTDKNPYTPGEKAELGTGLYCETVVGKREQLLVPYALSDELWKDNPDIQLNMVSYYGVPIRWPDGEVFGTFCVLDDKENHYNKDQKTLISKFAELVERDLDILQRREQTLSTLAFRETQIREIRHRMKNQLNMLISYIDLHRLTGESDSSNLAGDIQNRIKTLYKLHETLARTEIDLTVSLPQQLKELADEILSGCSFDIQADVGGSEIYLDEDLLVPVSMIINELITNSIKHAFNDVIHPRIAIECAEDEHAVSILYKDNGNSSQPDEKLREGLGSLIIKGIASQLSAATEKSFEKGFHFMLTIPKKS